MYDISKVVELNYTVTKNLFRRLTKISVEIMKKEIAL